jgi:CheY-like chemotaxis protein
LSIETSPRELNEVDGPMYGAPPGSYICLRISDDGTGMSEEVRNRAFEPFYTTKPRGEGTGLGLATVYGIVMQSGGFARIYSDEGVGTTFTILLPTVPEEDHPLDEVAAHAAEDLGGGETILVVDDEAGLREVARRILTRNGYEVLLAGSGADAIEIAQSHEGTIDVLLTDVVMPRMQGPEVAQRVKAIRPSIRTIFMSGHAKPVLEAEDILGTDFIFIEKPFDQSDLLVKVFLALHREAGAPS